MSILIDGYNLLHAAGILAHNVGPGGLERARLALLNFLAESLEANELARTTVVFDAHQPPWGAPRRMTHRGVAVIFAAGREDADSLIEELIDADHAPRQLTVVSSDRRVQRAARRRGAKAAASDGWYAEIVARRRRRAEQRREAAERPAVPLLAEDVEYWIGQFGGESELTRFLQEESARIEAQQPSPHERPTGDISDKPKHAPPDHPPPQQPPRRRPKTSAPEDRKPSSTFNPFPPGYGEDVEG